MVQSAPAMKWKALTYLPLAFLAGTHGFALFAPYVAVVLAALHLRTVRRQRRSARERSALPAVAAPTPGSLAAPALAAVPA